MHTGSPDTAALRLVLVPGSGSQLSIGSPKGAASVVRGRTLAHGVFMRPEIALDTRRCCITLSSATLK